MRMDRPVEGGYRSAFSSHCGDRRSFLFLFGHHLGIILFPKGNRIAAPIGEDTQTFYNLKNFAYFFKCLQSQYIGANRFAAPIYCRSARRTKLFAAPRLFGQTMPIQSAGVSGSGNRIIPRWRPN
jgi:hypothetical protein